MGLLDFDYEKLQTNPLLQMGLGIMANNQGHGGAFMPAFGTGVQQGMQNLNHIKQQQLMNGMRQQQFDMQKAQNDRAIEQENRTLQAINRFKQNKPEYADAIEIDAKAALKAAYPTMNGADPYFTPIPTENGLGSYNNRTGKFEILNSGSGPIIKSTDSPRLQGEIAGSKSYNSNLYDPTDIIDGRVMPKSSAAIVGGAPLPSYQGNIPYQPTWNGQPMGAPNTTRTDAIEGDANIQLRDPSNPNKPSGLGYKVPTKAEEAALVEKAKSEVGVNAEKGKNVRKADQFLSVAQQAQSILNNKDSKPTDSGMGAVVDSAKGFFGFADKGAEQASKLDALSGWMVANVPRMEGPQSNFDVQNYQTMAGLIGDRTKPINVRQAALNEVIRLQEKYKDLNKDGNIMPKGEQMPKENKAKSKQFDVGGKKELAVLGADGSYYVTKNGKKFRVEED